jgi:hypothetical protein
MSTAAPDKLLNAKQAAQQAVEYLNELIPCRGQRLEEVELDDDDRHWLITLSFFPYEDGGTGFGMREYRTFKVDGATGQVRSMKIRTL